MAQHSCFYKKEEPVVLMTGLSFTRHQCSVHLEMRAAEYRGWYSGFFLCQTIELGQVGRMEKREETTVVTKSSFTLILDHVGCIL